MQMLFCVLIFFVWEYFFFMKKKCNKNFFNNNSKDLKPVRLLLATLQTGNTVCHVWLTLTLHISQPHFLEILFEHFAPFILSIRGSLLCLPPPHPTPSTTSTTPSPAALRPQAHHSHSPHAPSLGCVCHPHQKGCHLL